MLYVLGAQREGAYDHLRKLPRRSDAGVECEKINRS